jgi:hypothetical protein
MIDGLGCKLQKSFVFLVLNFHEMFQPVQIPVAPCNEAAVDLKVAIVQKDAVVPRAHEPMVLDLRGPVPSEKSVDKVFDLKVLVMKNAILPRGRSVRKTNAQQPHVRRSVVSLHHELNVLGAESAPSVSKAALAVSDLFDVVAAAAAASVNLGTRFPRPSRKRRPQSFLGIAR